MIDKKRFTDLCEKNEITIDNTAFDRFDLFAELLVEWNKKMNLTAITEPQEIVMNFNGLKKKHLLKGVECVTYHSDDPDADNTLDEPNKIIPVSQPLDFTGDVLSTSVAAKTFAVYVLAIK